MRYLFRKVPEITIYFWIIKLLTTAVGESTSDYLVFRINPYEAVTIGGIAFMIAIAIQFRVRKYVPWVYWLAVAMVAVFGTMAADGVHIQLGIPYAISAIFFAAVLTVIFFMWQKGEKTLSIHSITTPKREVFYWATVLATFALGTAVGDLTATTFGLGYFSSAILFAGLIIVPAVAYWKFGLNEVVAFWSAYIITRPLGASIADWLGKPKTSGGLGWSDARVSFMLTILIVIFVAFLSISRVDIKRSRSS